MFKISPADCASFHKGPIQSRLRLYSSISEPLAAYHTVACGGSMGFVCPKIHFIDVVGKPPCLKSTGPNSHPLILFIRNLLQKIGILGSVGWRHTPARYVSFELQACARLLPEKISRRPQVSSFHPRNARSGFPLKSANLAEAQQGDTKTCFH